MPSPPFPPHLRILRFQHCKCNKFTLIKKAPVKAEVDPVWISGRKALSLDLTKNGQQKTDAKYFHKPQWDSAAGGDEACGRAGKGG